MLITPEYVFKDVTHIMPEWLAQKGIRALVLDIDKWPGGWKPCTGRA